jgi:hypothetical protein
MPVYGTEKALCLFGYFDDNQCIGGAYLTSDYPHDLVMEFYTSKPSVAKAIGESYVGMLKHKSKLSARIKKTNRKSLKMVRLLGFYRLYEDGGDVIVEFAPERWRFKNRWDIFGV